MKRAVIAIALILAGLVVYAAGAHHAHVASEEAAYERERQHPVGATHVKPANLDLPISASADNTVVEAAEEWAEKEGVSRIMRLWYEGSQAEQGAAACPVPDQGSAVDPDTCMGSISVVLERELREAVRTVRGVGAHARTRGCAQVLDSLARSIAGEQPIVSRLATINIMASTSLEPKQVNASMFNELASAAKNVGRSGSPLAAACQKAMTP